jgi:glycosyltransferase involved in cell wall biosynthesis
MRRSISVIIPAYNEEGRLPSTLSRVKEYLSSRHWEFSEIIVVDDGSADGTAFVAAAAGARVFRNPGNQGKGYSVRQGVLQASGDWVLFSDADLSAPIDELETLWSAAAQSGAKCVIGSRALDRSLIGVRQPVFREQMGRIFNFLMRVVTGLKVRDTQCGFKLLERNLAHKVFRRQRLAGFGFDVEVLFITQRMDQLILEVPIRWNDVAGSKVSMILGAKSFLDPVRVRLNCLRGHYG